MILLTGHAGTGKTKLLSHLLGCLDDTRAAFYLPYSAVLIEDFIGFVATALDIHLPDGSDIFTALQDGLVELAEDGDKPILLIDDAHCLGCDVLENLIGLFQLGDGEHSLAQLVLVAHPEIEYTLERSELRELQENLARMSRLEPLGRADVEPYVEYALRVVGYEGDPVFSPDAIQAVATHTRGIPQLVNTLCGASFLVAYGRDENPVSVDTVEAAIEEVAGIAMVDTADRGLENLDPTWVVELDADAGEGRLPNIVRAWLKRSRRWPIAAVGVGGSVALVAILVLFGALPFHDSTANAHQNDRNSALNGRITQLSSDVNKANGERDRLRIELSARVDERDVLAEKLSRLEVLHLAEKTLMGGIKDEEETPDEVITVALAEKSVDTSESAEDLLAELMRSAESEADVLLETGPDGAPITYRVRPGDTLWKIATDHGMRVDALLAANAMNDATTLSIGQKLKVDAKSSNVSAVFAPIATKEHTGGDWYVVRPGDSLYGIGRKFESSVDDLLRWNQLADVGSLQVGQKLRLVPIQ